MGPTKAATPRINTHDLAAELYLRILASRKTVGVYMDSEGNFRASPICGIRFQNIAEDFPDAIVGVYNDRVFEDDLEADLNDFCRQLGYV